MADLFRKSSIEKLSNPEQLDRSIKIASPMSWLALLGVVLVIVSTLIWSLFGVLPTTKSVTGILVSSENACAYYADKSGKVLKKYVNSGDEVKKGDTIIKVKSNDGEEHSIKADNNGKITKLLVDVGVELFSGTEIARFTPDLAYDNIVVCFVPLIEAQKITKDMKVLLYPSSVDSQKYGHMEAEVYSVSEYAVNAGNLKYVLGSDNLVADQFINNGPVISVICKIKTEGIKF